MRSGTKDSVPRSGLGDFFNPMDIGNWLLFAALLIWLVAAVHFYGRTQTSRRFDWIHFMTRIGVFGAISTILYVVPLFHFNVFFLPSFLELHFDEIPAFIAGFAYGPTTAFGILLIKTLIKVMMGSTTMYVGELSDLIYSTVFVIPAVWIYQKKRNMKGVAIGFVISTSLHLVVTSVLNVFAMLPFYMYLYGMTYEGLLSLCQLANPAIKDLYWGYTLFANLPLNLIKDAIVIAVTFGVYRSIHQLLHYDKTPRK